MLDLLLHEQILTFVKTFRVVREDQIYKFFSDCGHSDVEYELKGLKIAKRLYDHPEGRISTKMNLHAPMSAFDSCIDALEVMCLSTMRSQQVNWMLAMPYPVDIMFGTTANAVFDVTTFDINWQAKYSLTGITRAKTLPPGEPDIVNHVAVVHDEQLIHKIAPLGFSHFLVIGPDRQIEVYEA